MMVRLEDIYNESNIFGLKLDEINMMIVDLTLRANRNNMNKTAEQLGISRTTLWRYLNRKK